MKTIIAAALAVSFAVPAWAQSNCAPIAEVVQILMGMYGEEVATQGVDLNGQLVQMWGNPASGSWSATVTNGETMCIVAQGGGFERMAFRPNL